MNEISILASTMFLEAGGEPLVGIIAVACVIHNLSIQRHSAYMDTCLKPKLFSCWNTGEEAARTRVMQMRKNQKNNARYQTCLSLAIQMSCGYFSPPFPNINHYYAPALCHPKWADKLTHKEHIGGHTFGYLPY